MVDVQHLKDKGIPIRIDGNMRYVRGATKYTTCSDVIKMVLKKTGIGKEYRHLFAIYEVTSEEEKQLPCKSRIVRVVEAWDGANNRLVLRKTDPISDGPEPLELGPKIEKSKTKKLKSPVRSQPRDAAYLQTLISLSKFVDKQKDKLETNSQRPVADESSTDSESSMDEFLSSLDKSKMAGFVHFFAAMAGGKREKKPRTKAHTKSGSRPQTTESDESSEHSPVFSRRHKWRCRYVAKSKHQTRINRKSKKSTADDIHPNKIHRIEPMQHINFGFIDVEPTSRDQVYTHVAKNENQNPTRDPRSRINPYRPCTARRRLLIGNRKSEYSFTSTHSNRSVHLQNTSLSTTPEEEFMAVGTFRPIQPDISVVARRDRLSLPGNLIGCHGNDFRRGFHDRSINTIIRDRTPLDLDQAFMVQCALENDKEECHGIATPSSPPFTLLNTGLSPIPCPEPLFPQKLVDYSISDDESEDLSDMDTACSKCSNTSGSNSLSSESSNPSIGYHTGSDVDNNRCAMKMNKMADVGAVNGKHARNMAVNKDISEYIRSVFSKGCAMSEDDAMGSFMNSMCEASDGDKKRNSTEMTESAVGYAIRL